MTKTDYPMQINRRRLLASLAAIPAASIVPGVEPTDPAAAAGIQSSAMTPEAGPVSCCAATARRLLGNRPKERNSPGGWITRSVRCAGNAPDQTAGGFREVRAVRGGEWQGDFGTGTQAPPRGRG